MKGFILFVWLFISVQITTAQTSYTWNGTTSTIWNIATNWTPNGIPGSGDNVTIVTGSNNCVLDGAHSVTNITLTSGTLNLNGYALLSSGNAIFTAGTVTNGTLTVNAGTGNTATLTNTTFSASGILNITTGAITLNGGMYGGAVTCNQTGATQTTGTGGATFNSTLSITNSGTSNFRINGGCTYNGATTFSNSGSGYFLPELTTGSTYGGSLTLNNTSATQNIRMAYLGATNFNGNIIINNTGGGSFTFCEQASATATLAAGQTISVGVSGFNIGTLTLSRFTQVGTTAQNLTLTGTATATFNNSTTFNGALTLNSPNIYTSNCTYNGVTILTKTDGTNTNQTTGGNTFNNTLTINYNAGSGAGSWFGFANGAADIYNGDVYVNNNSFDRILWGVGASSNTQFNGNLIVTQIGSSLGIATAWSAASTCVMAAGKTISIGGAGFNTGYLYIQGLTQNGNAAINLTATGNSSVYVGQGASVGPCTIGGSLTITAPDVYLRGGTYNGAVVVTKTGGTNNHNNSQQNIFNSTCTINQQSNGGYFMLGYNSNDLFNGNITVTSTGSGGINLGYSSGAGTPTLSSGNTILVGAAGFSAGSLYLGTFTQLGTAAMNLTFTGASTALTFAGNSVIGGNLTTNTPDVLFNGATFNGSVNTTKTGANSDAGNGGNTFQSTSNFTNTGTGYLMFGNGTADTWNGDVTFNNSGAERILPCWNSSGNKFNGNLIVSNTGSAVGIEFCGGTAAASCTVAATKNIQIGAAGYNTGYLHLYRFTQLGSAASNLTFTGAATVLVVGPTSAIGGDFTVVSPRILLNGATYSGNVNLTKNGSTGEWSTGGNTFNGTTTINQLGAGYFGFANGAPDIFNGDLYANNNSTERIIFGNSPVGNQFNGNIILTQIGSSVGIAFGWSASTNETMAAGKTISIGAAGFNVGYLQIAQFTQLGSTAMNLPLTGTASLTFGPTSAIGGNLTSTSASLFFNGCTFNGTVNATKNGVTGDASSGGNVFQGVSSFTNNGSGYLLFGNGTADTWNADVTFTDAGSERILPCYNSVGNQFNGNIIFNSTGSSVGISFCAGSATATAIQAAGYGLSIGGAGFSAGYLVLQRFTQLGNAATNLTLTSTANFLQFGPSSTLGGNVTSSSPGLYFNGCTFSGTVNSTKTGATNDNSSGNNVFNGVTTITNSGAGQLLLGNGNVDQFNTTSTFNNTGSNNIYVAWNSSNNVFGGIATFNNTPTSNTGIYVSWNSTGTIFNNNIVVTSNNGVGVGFCGGNTTATATLTAGNTISVGAGGFSAGTLLLKQFTQLGGTAQALTLTSTSILNVGPSSAFGGNVNFLAPQLNLNGCTYSGTATLEQNGATSSSGSGGNIFNGTTTITNSGSAQFLTGNTNADQFNGVTTFNNTGSYRFYFAQNHAGQTTTFANTLTMNSAKTGSGDAWSFFAGEGNNTAITFANTVTMNCSGVIQSNWRFLNGSGATAVFNGDVTINVTNTNASTQLQMGTTGTSTYNGNIITVNNGGAAGIVFNANATASSTLANTKTITVGAGGFNAGGLYLYRFTQIGGTPQSLTLTGTANLTFGPTSAFGGNVTCSSPTLFFNGCTYSGTVNATKTGSTNDGSVGNNIFNGAATMINSGSGYLMFGNGNSDQFNVASTFNNTGSSSIYVAYNSANNIFGGTATFNNSATTNSPIYVSWLSTGTTFNSNIVVTSTNGGVQFCGGNTTATATLSAGNTITVGAGGFSVGTLLLRQFTQVGATAQSLTLTGTGNLTFGPTSAFGGNVTCTSPTLFFNGCTYSGTTNCTKNGTTNDASAGNNIFTGVSTMNNSGAGYLMFGNGNSDQWLTDVTYNNTGSNIIYAAYASANNTFGGNVTCNNNGSTGNNSGIYICANNNSTGSTTGNLIVNNNSASGTNNGIRVCEGSSTSFSVGGTTTVTNTNANTSNYIRFSNGAGSSTTFGGDVTVTNNGTVASTNVVHFGYTGTSIFNGNITLNSTGGAGVVFGGNTGTSTQANNKTINTSTFTGGPLYIRNFTQTAPTTGNTSNVSITGTNMPLTFISSLFYDNVTGSSQEITASGSTFNGTALLTKVSGNANDLFPGGNIFNGATTITNQSTFVLGMANTTADAYNGNVTFVQTNTGALKPSYNTNCTYAGNITVTSPAATAITFGAGGASGISTMNGSGATAQTINITTGKAPIFTQFVMNNTGSAGVTLNTPINISTSLALTSGLLNTTATNLLIMLNASTAPALTATSTTYVNGPMQYQMAVANATNTLNFPIGTSPDCRPTALTVRHSAATQYNYTAQLFNANPWTAFNSGSPYIATNMPTTVDTISGVHYWTINRTDNTGTSQPNANLAYSAGVYPLIQLNFGVNDDVLQGSTLTIVKNTSATPAAWIDIGGTSALGNFSTPQVGSVTSTSSPTAFNSFSSFTLGSRNAGWNPLPIEILYFTAKPLNNRVELDWVTATETNNNYFTIEKSKDGVNFEFLQKVNSEALNGNSTTNLNYKTYDLNPYSGVNYYRLKQTDFNGNYKYTSIAQVNFDTRSFVFVFPNPAVNNIFVNVSTDYDNTTAKIMDALGREVLSQTINSSAINTINTTTLESGMYYIIINNGTELNKTKITIQK